MSKQFPVVAVTGSSGAGTSSVLGVIEAICREQQIRFQSLCGDAMHRFNRREMDAEIARYRKTQQGYFSHFSPQANLLATLAQTFKEFGETGHTQVRNYIHTEEEGIPFGQPAGTLTPWRPSIADAQMLLYEGLHGGYVGDDADVARHVDLLIGVVPNINLEWIQKLHRDPKVRGVNKQTVIEVILQRMPDYVQYICPQFSRTYINFQRVAMVDTANPFDVADVPTADESMVVIRFAEPSAFDFPYLLAMLHHAQMSKPDTLVVPGGKMHLAMRLILTPLIQHLMQQRTAVACAQ